MGDNTATAPEKIKETLPTITLYENQLPTKDKGIDDIFDLVIKVKVVGVNRNNWENSKKKRITLQIEKIKKQNYEEEYANHFSK